jgi:hypothetical protein
MFEYHVAYHTISQVANNKVQTYLESKIRVHEEEKKLSLTQNQELQQELETMKIIVAYIYQVYSTIRYYYFWHARGSSECKFSASCGAYGLSLKVVL